MKDLLDKAKRSALTARESFYSQIIGEGRALCYRKRRSGSAGRWYIRTSKPNGGYAYEKLGAADDFAEANGRQILSYEQALASAVGKDRADPTKIPVRQALDEWSDAKCLEATTCRQRRAYRSQAMRVGRPFAARTLKTITVKDILDWRNSFVDGADDPQPRKSSANRELATLKAALNLAAKTHLFQGKRAWDEVPKFKHSESHGSRVLVLSVEEENQLIDTAPPELGVFLSALQKTGARVGEIQSAKVRSLRANMLTLTGKTGTRTIPLSEEKAGWFGEQAAGKSDGDPLISRTDGSAWPENGHIKAMNRTVKKMGLAEETVAYVFRHGFITRALENGVPTAAVAKYCGTSVRMIEQTYAHFAQGTLSKWFE